MRMPIMSFYSKYIKKNKRKFLSFVADLYSKLGAKNLKENTELLNTLTEYIKISDSTGCSFSDLWILYNYTKKINQKKY